MDDTFEFDALPEAELMHVDALQKLTDDYVRTINPGRKPQQIWKPFIEELFKDILKPNWRTRYKLWVYDLKHLQRVALLLANTDKNLLGDIKFRFLSSRSANLPNQLLWLLFCRKLDLVVCRRNSRSLLVNKYAQILDRLCPANVRS